MTLRRLIALLGFAITVATCDNSLAQAPSPQTAASRPVPTPVARVPAAPPNYERKGRRDPFQPIEIIQPDVTPPAVASARLKGIVRGSLPRVLLETPDGMGYIMTVGDTLADGRLIEIGADSVVFSVPRRRGSTTDRIVLQLPSD